MAGVVVVDERVDAVDFGVGDGAGLLQPPVEAVGDVDLFVIVLQKLFVDSNEAEVQEIGGDVDGKWINSIVAGDPAAAVMLQQVKGALHFPRGVTKFDGIAEICGKIFEERFHVGKFGGGEGRRELDQDGTEFIGLLHRAEVRRKEFIDGLPKEMGALWVICFGVLTQKVKLAGTASVHF